MDFTEYRKRGKEMVDYIADYLENIRDRRVFPDVKPGYMKNLLPDSAPLEGEQWETIFSDVERVIMPGITHWQSPHMHAYFPALNSFPSLLGDMLADAINCLGFTWASSPACTELEIIVMNWLGKMINLPDDFLHLNSSSRGGGVVQTTASEATLVCLLAGRTRAIQRFHEKRPGYQDAEINARLVAYCSDQAHSSVEKAALIGLVRMRYIEADENLSMRGQILREAIEDDIRQGLVPFWVCATLGTTGSCSFDNLEEIGIVCREFNLWLHVDAAYAGSAFICPEFRTWLKGIERADSIAFNPSKWLMVHFDATALWVKDSTAVHRTFNVEPLYLQHENSGVAIDFMHWQIPLSRRFRALKMWFVLRSFGIKGLQRHIREGVRLAQKFEALVLADHRFEIPAKRHLGLVVFRIKGENEITERLLKRLNHRGNLHCIPSSLKGKYVIRFTVTSTRTTVDDILRDWMEIKNSATAILDEMNITISNRVYLKDTKEKCEGFGSSLLLSNSPLSPKIVNGSFAALFDADEFLAKTYAGIRIAHQESPSMRRRVRGIMMSGKQFSLDSHMDVVVQTSINSHTTNTKMMDSYGNTSTSSKNEERDSICEDEESVEDCEMNWILNTALQLNSTNYIAVLNNQKLIPIDIIRRPNNLQSSAASSAFLTKYSTKYEINKNFTKSVNSVRTPLTQCQLYKFPRQTSITQKYQEKVTEKLYHGKRYLNLDLAEQSDSMFTDTIYNLPTPTEEIIPIIITADTPTSSTKCIPNIEEPNKLHPPNSCLLLDVNTDKDDLHEKFKCNSSSNLKPIEECNEDLTILSKMVNSPSMDMLSDICKGEDTSINKRNEICGNSPTGNIIPDFNKPLPSKSTLIPVFETTDETNYLTEIFPTIPTKLSSLPSNSSITNLNLSRDKQESPVIHNKLFTTSSSHSSEEYKDATCDRIIRRPIFSIISNQESSSDSMETKESETISSTANYLFKSSLLQQPIYSTLISNESYSDDSQDIPQFINTFNEDLKEMTTNLNSLFSNKPLSEDGSSYNIETPKSSTIEEDDLVFEELNKLCSIQRPKSLTFADFSIFNELTLASNIQASKSCNEIEDAINISPKSLINTELQQDNIKQTSKDTFPLEMETKLLYKEKEPNLELKDQKLTQDIVDQTLKDSSLFKQESFIQTSTSWNEIKDAINVSPKSLIKSELPQDIIKQTSNDTFPLQKESKLLYREKGPNLDEQELLQDIANQTSKDSFLFNQESFIQTSKLSYDKMETDFELDDYSTKSNLPRPNSLNFADFSKFKESCNIKTSKSFNVPKETTPQLEEKAKIENEIPSPKYTILVESSLLFKELAKGNEFETSSSIETPKSLTITENYEILKESTNEIGNETPKSYSREEDNAAGATAAAGIIYLTKNLKNNKSQDDSSSSDEFLETFCQPSKDSKSSSSSSSSSLDLL